MLAVCNSCIGYRYWGPVSGYRPEPKDVESDPAVAIEAPPVCAEDVGGGAATGSSPTPTWVILTCGAAAVFFVGAALRSFYVVVRGPRRPVANVLMTVGMGVSFAALVL